MTAPVLDLHVDHDSGLAPYLQLVRQVWQALRLGLLREGDQLPTVKELAERLSINANTVLKVYRELEYQGVVSAQRGVGTFIRVTLADSVLVENGPLREELLRWVAAARRAGLDDECIEALFSVTLRTSREAIRSGVAAS